MLEVWSGYLKASLAAGLILKEAQCVFEVSRIKSRG